MIARTRELQSYTSMRATRTEYQPETQPFIAKYIARFGASGAISLFRIRLALALRSHPRIKYDALKLTQNLTWRPSIWEP